MKRLLHQGILRSTLLVLGALIAFGCAKSADDLYKDGLVELEKGNIEIARQRLEAALEQDPDLMSAYRHLARIYGLQNETDKLIQTLERWVEKQPFESTPRRQLAALYLQKSRFEEALKIYEDLAASAVNEQEKEAYQKWVGMLQRAQERQVEIKQLEAQLGQEPDNPGLNRELGALYFRVGQNFVVTGQKEPGKQLLQRSHTLLEQAKNLLETQIAEEREVASARIELASVYFELGQHALLPADAEQAIGLFEKAIAYRPDQPKYYFVLSQLHGNRKEYPQAIAAVKKAIRLDPETALYYEALSRYSLKAEDQKECEAALRQADQVSPNSGNYLFNLAVLYEKWGRDRSDTMQLLEKALEKEPENAQYRFSLAGFLGQEKRYKESLAELREVLRVGAGTRWESLAQQMIEKTETLMQSESE